MPDDTHPGIEPDIPPKVAQVIEKMHADLQRAKTVIDEQKKEPPSAESSPA